VDQAQADANSERRQARHAGLVRALLETATHDDDALERGALIASSAAVAAERYEVAASLAWRAAEWRRRLGDTDGASRWHGRGQSALQHLARPDHDGLFALGEGLTRLTTDGPAAALPALDRACEKLAIAEAASVPGAARALLRARLARAQCDALRGLPGGQAHLRELLERIGPDDPAARASALHTLACARMEAGDREEARQLFDEASTERGAAGGFDDAAEAALLVARSRSMRPSPPGSTEVNYLERARVLSGGDLDRRARQTLPLVLHEIGLGAGEVGETELAATLLDEAAMMAESLPEEAPVRAAVSYARGLLFLAGGDALRAEKALEKALASWERSPDGKASDRALGRAAVAWIQARRGAAPNRDAQDALLLALDALQGADAVDPGLLAQLHALHADLTSAP
jgi:tetratricopeptide (TPR) repeat protein